MISFQRVLLKLYLPCMHRSQWYIIRVLLHLEPREFSFVTFFLSQEQNILINGIYSNKFQIISNEWFQSRGRKLLYGFQMSSPRTLSDF